jgi:N-acetylglutamate synthase-like GNAT family acetyltransferase
METWAVYDNKQAIGFASINKHFSETAEIHVMGIQPEFHGKGIGHQLLEEFKTLWGPDNPCLFLVKAL